MSQITINGSTYYGNNIVIKNNKIIVDGANVTPDSKEINITVNGDVNNLEVDSCNKISITGNVNKFSGGSGDVECHDIINGVTTGSGDIKCNNINGDVRTGSGDVECDSTITGSVKTSSGDIKYRK